MGLVKWGCAQVSSGPQPVKNSFPLEGAFLLFSHLCCCCSLAFCLSVSVCVFVPGLCRRKPLPVPASFACLCRTYLHFCLYLFFFLCFLCCMCCRRSFGSLSSPFVDGQCVNSSICSPPDQCTYFPTFEVHLRFLQGPAACSLLPSRAAAAACFSSSSRAPLGGSPGGPLQGAPQGPRGLQGGLPGHSEGEPVLSLAAPPRRTRPGLFPSVFAIEFLAPLKMVNFAIQYLLSFRFYFIFMARTTFQVRAQTEAASPQSPRHRLSVTAEMGQRLLHAEAYEGAQEFSEARHFCPGGGLRV